MFDFEMGPDPAELERLAEEARACRERLQELLKITSELRRLIGEAGEPNGEAPLKLQSIP
jgi:hypothetical protein